MHTRRKMRVAWITTFDRHATFKMHGFELDDLDVAKDAARMAYDAEAKHWIVNHRDVSDLIEAMEEEGFVVVVKGAEEAPPPPRRRRIPRSYDPDTEFQEAQRSSHWDD